MSCGGVFFFGGGVAASNQVQLCGLLGGVVFFSWGLDGLDTVITSRVLCDMG